MAKLLIAAAFLVQNVAFALNDWNVPCLGGQCSYDVSNGTASGSIALVCFIPCFGPQWLTTSLIGGFIVRDI